MKKSNFIAKYGRMFLPYVRFRNRSKRVVKQILTQAEQTKRRVEELTGMPHDVMHLYTALQKDIDADMGYFSRAEIFVRGANWKKVEEELNAFEKSLEENIGD